MAGNRNQSSGRTQIGKSNKNSAGAHEKNGREAGNSGQNLENLSTTANVKSGQNRQQPQESVSGNGGQNVLRESANVSKGGSGVTHSKEQRTVNQSCNVATGTTKTSGMNSQKQIQNVPSTLMASGRHASYGKSGKQYEAAQTGLGSGQVNETLRGAENNSRNQAHTQTQKDNHPGSGESASAPVGSPQTNSSEPTVSRTLGSNDTFSAGEVNNTNENEEHKDSGNNVGVSADNLVPITEVNKELEQKNNSETVPVQNSNGESEMVEQSEEEEENRAEDDSEGDDISTEYEDMSEEAVLERLKILKEGNPTCSKQLCEGGGDGLMTENRFGTQEDIQKSTVNQNGKTVNTLGGKEKNNEINPTLQVEDQCETSNLGDRGNVKNKKKDGTMNPGKQNTVVLVNRTLLVGVVVWFLAFRPVWCQRLLTPRCTYGRRGTLAHPAGDVVKASQSGAQVSAV
nr:hypothetical protein Iba_chr09fCG10960 [Ipomoea batatas]